MTDMLGMRGYKICSAKDGQEAIEQVSSFKPDLILMDIKMPKMDGLVATRKLRSMPAFASLPIIALTANADTISKEQALAAGCTAYITKPIQSDAVFALLDRYLIQEVRPRTGEDNQ